MSSILPIPLASQKALTWVVEQLRSKYTGRIELEVKDGSIRRIQVSHCLVPSDEGMQITGGGKHAPMPEVP